MNRQWFRRYNSRVFLIARATAEIQKIDARLHFGSNNFRSGRFLRVATGSLSMVLTSENNMNASSNFLVVTERWQCAASKSGISVLQNGQFVIGHENHQMPGEKTNICFLDKQTRKHSGNIGSTEPEETQEGGEWLVEIKVPFTWFPTRCPFLSFWASQYRYPHSN